MSLAGLDTGGMEHVEERDSLGGGVLDGGVYPFRIEVAYTLKADSGALGFTTIFMNRDGQKITNTQYITGGDAKGNKPYYVRDGKKIPLPGYSHVDFMTDLLLNKPLTQLESQEATLKIWNKDAGKEVPTKVTVYPELRGKDVLLGLTKVRENKSKKVGKDYVPTAEERVFNEVDKFFDAETGKTKTELRGGEEATFIEKWKAKFEGQLVDKYKEIKGAPQSGATGGSPFGDDSSSPSQSLFGDND